ncbi:DUF485 domain-containing protein [Streptomyces phaeofaciens]|uniref:DUF485 domain-containing protein n=1 Tax=Streptomyces phaeofaciens TaxID=68254 RepID=UPI0036A89DDA
MALVTGGIFAVFLLLSAFAPGAMAAPLPGGGVPAGVMAGLLHPPFTVAVLWWYERTAGRREREVGR